MEIIKNNYKEITVRMKCSNCKSTFRVSSKDIHSANNICDLFSKNKRLFKREKYRVYCPVCSKPKYFSKWRLKRRLYQRVQDNLLSDI